MTSPGIPPSGVPPPGVPPPGVPPPGVPPPGVPPPGVFTLGTVTTKGSLKYFPKLLLINNSLSDGFPMFEISSDKLFCEVAAVFTYRKRLLPYLRTHI
ncbi:hypothetical protein DX130_19870 [Paenibacillus paeoniae]|uniref:Uncharacterized protein n=1 Tax=Paenibacillus paeoniae TaxID=2292705 RepID=A0A371P7Q8_9BACL|nr:hypothetical protein DX130_19870 [Paenibacillus paeoniae]